MLLEPAAAEMAAQRITPAELESLRRLVGFGPRRSPPPYSRGRLTSTGNFTLASPKCRRTAASSSSTN